MHRLCQGRLCKTIVTSSCGSANVYMYTFASTPFFPKDCVDTVSSVRSLLFAEANSRNTHVTPNRCSGARDYPALITQLSRRSQLPSREGLSMPTPLRAPVVAQARRLRRALLGRGKRIDGQTNRQIDKLAERQTDSDRQRQAATDGETCRRTDWQLITILGEALVAPHGARIGSTMGLL